MVLVVALLFYFVIAMLPEQQRAYEDYRRTQETNKIHAAAATEEEIAETDNSDSELDKQRDAAREAMNRVNAEEEHRTIAQAEEEQRRASEQALAEELARESAQAEALGMVTEVALEAGFFSFKPLGEQQISEGLVVALRRGADEYIICEAVVTRFYAESGEFIADIKNDPFTTTQEGDIERPKPAKGDLVIITPFDTADQLRRESAEATEQGL